VSRPRTPQTAGDANVRFASSARGKRGGCAPCSYNFFASRRRALTNLAVSRACRACWPIACEISEFSLDLEAQYRARTSQWLSACPTESDMDIFMDRIRASGS
jgi:hypothetical protein